jgi:hypothetical protein
MAWLDVARPSPQILVNNYKLKMNLLLAILKEPPHILQKWPSE